MSGRVLIIGASSSIGCAIAHRLAADRKRLLLAGRDSDEMATIAADLRLRYNAEVSTQVFEALAFATHGTFFNTLHENDALEGIILCHGYMVDQALSETDFEEAVKTFDINLTSYVSILHRAAHYFRERGGGYICALSSVAGDRGRQSNFTYGASKAGLTVYLQGLRNRLAPYGVAVITVKPGFVDTGMTWGLLKPGSPLVATPDRVAGDIVRVIERRRDVIYTPWFWRWIMAIICSIPERVFKRLKL